jgi:acetoin utilization protein AcuB
MEMPVKSFMSGDPVWITADASALEAFERMLDRGIRHLPVLDSERRVVGVLSIDDLRAALPYSAALNQPLAPLEREVAREWQVGEIMSHDPVTLGPDATLGEAAACMAERRIGCLAIVDESGRLSGLLSETDVLWAVANSGELRKAAAPAAATDVLDALVRELSQERERVRKRLAKNIAAEKSIETDLREVPLDTAERGADVTLMQESIALDELALRRLAAIDQALDRAAQGQLGNCVRCGNVIPIPRLRALPSTTLCIACARSQPGASRP